MMLMILLSNSMSKPVDHSVALLSKQEECANEIDPIFDSTHKDSGSDVRYCQTNDEHAFMTARPSQLSQSNGNQPHCVSLPLAAEASER